MDKESGTIEEAETTEEETVKARLEDVIDEDKWLPEETWLWLAHPDDDDDNDDPEVEADGHPEDTQEAELDAADHEWEMTAEEPAACVISGRGGKPVGV